MLYTKSQRLKLLNESMLGYMTKIIFANICPEERNSCDMSAITDAIPGAFNINQENRTFDVNTSEGVMHVTFKDGVFREYRVD